MSIILVTLLLLPSSGIQVSAYTHKLSPIERLNALDEAIGLYQLSLHDLFNAVASGIIKDVKEAQGEVFDSRTEVQHINKFIKKDAKQSKILNKELFTGYLKLIKRMKVLNNAELCMSVAADTATVDKEQAMKFIACSSIFLAAYAKVKTGIEDVINLLKQQPLVY